MRANDRQEGGDHYRQKGVETPQHWDLAVMYDWDAFQYQITKYVMRWKDKHDSFEKRLVDLTKARHFLDKYIEEARHYDDLHQMLKHPATEVHVVSRNQNDMDREYEAQRVAAATFTEDGFTKDGNWYQCVKCKQRILAGSPLGAQYAHRCQGMPGAVSVAPDHSYGPAEGISGTLVQPHSNGAAS